MCWREGERYQELKRLGWVGVPDAWSWSVLVEQVPTDSLKGTPHLHTGSTPTVGDTYREDGLSWRSAITSEIDGLSLVGVIVALGIVAALTTM